METMNRLASGGVLLQSPDDLLIQALDLTSDAILIVGREGQPCHLNKPAGQVLGIQTRHASLSEIHRKIPALRPLLRQGEERGAPRAGATLQSIRLGARTFEMHTLQQDSATGPSWIVRLRAEQPTGGPKATPTGLENVAQAISVVTHDLNNLLHCIVLCTDMLRNHRPEDVEGEAPLLARIVHAATRSSELVRKIMELGMGRASAAESVVFDELVGGVIDISKVITDQVRILKRLRAGKARVSMIRADVFQIVFNVLLNAIQASSSRGVVEVDTATRSADAGAPDCVCVTITDKAGQLRTEDASQVFQPRVSRSRHGFGLGLAGVRSLVFQQGGQIAVECDPGVQTRVSVCLPRCSAEP